MNMILRVDMTNLKVTQEEVPLEYQLLGGRALTSMITFKEVPPTCHPLRSKNKIVIAPGLLTGTKAPSSGRLSIGGKSPLTGGIKESNSGGVSSQKLARLGIKAIIIEGQAKPNFSYILVLNTNSFELKATETYKGMGTYKLNDEIRKEYGSKVGLICIGPAGEMKMCSAGISTNDMEGHPGRYAGRGGLGAVLGSKGLKAIVIDDEKGKTPSVNDSEGFNNAVKVLVKAIQNNEVTNSLLRARGTHIVLPIDEIGGLPTRNYSEGRFEGVGTMNGWYMAEVVKQRGGKGKMGHRCHPGCIINCSNIYPDKDGNVLCAPIEYESGVLLGPNLSIGDLDVIATLNRLCNDYGLDTMEVGATLGVLMDAGVVDFGDGKGAIELLEEVPKGSPMGRIIGMGSVGAGKAYGVTRVPAVKGQSMAAYDPRAIKGLGAVYATGTMGADHTSGFTVATEVFKIGGDLDPLSAEGKGELARIAQTGQAFIDSTGLCSFVTFATTDNEVGSQAITDLINAKYGTNMNADDIEEYGKEVLRIERAFNNAAGFTKADDRLPDFMCEESLAPHNTVFDVPDSDLDSVFNF